MSPRLSRWGKSCRWPRNRDFTDEEAIAQAAAGRRRAEWKAGLHKPITKDRWRKKPKRPAEIIAETDIAVRATLFLNDSEQRMNARYLRDNDDRPIKTDEEAATEQLAAESVAGQVDPAQAAKWLTADDIDSATGITATAWNAEIVGDRLIEAYRTLELLPLSTLPASYGSSMPAIIRDETDRKGQAELRESHDRARNRTKLTASSHEIFRMEEAFLWPIRLLKQEKFRRIVFFWAQWRAQRKNLRVMCKQKNFNYSTFMRRREIAVLAIAYELNQKKIPVKLGEKINSRARRRRKERNSTASTKKKTKVRAVIRGQVHDFS